MNEFIRLTEITDSQSSRNVESHACGVLSNN